MPRWKDERWLIYYHVTRRLISHHATMEGQKDERRLSVTITTLQWKDETCQDVKAKGGCSCAALCY